MTREFHKMIIVLALKLLSEKSDEWIAEQLGIQEYHVKESIEWCIENPGYPDDDLDKAMNDLIKRYAAVDVHNLIESRGIDGFSCF